MNKIYSLIFLFNFFLNGQATTYCNINGTDGSYNESFSMSTIRVMSSKSTCPNHHNLCLKGTTLCGGLITDAIYRSATYEIPAYPCFANATLNVTCKTGTLGMLRNGVLLYGQAIGVGCGDAVEVEGDTFDYCGGHASDLGDYHYHATPSCLLYQLNIAQKKSHGDILGWAFDGFPIYGPYGTNKELIYPCGNENANQSDCLDSCNGHMQHTVDGYLYHYHLPGNITDITTDPATPLPSHMFYPYTIGCFKGVLKEYAYIAENNTYSCSQPGTIKDFTPSLLEGITTVFSNTDYESSSIRFNNFNYLYTISLFLFIYLIKF